MESVCAVWLVVEKICRKVSRYGEVAASCNIQTCFPSSLLYSSSKTKLLAHVRHSYSLITKSIGQNTIRKNQETFMRILMVYLETVHLLWVVSGQFWGSFYSWVVTTTASSFGVVLEQFWGSFEVVWCSLCHFPKKRHFEVLLFTAKSTKLPQNYPKTTPKLPTNYSIEVTTPKLPRNYSTQMNGLRLYHF